MRNFDDLIRVRHPLIRNVIAEFFGTLVLVYVAHSTGVSYSAMSRSNPVGKLMGVTFGVGLAAFIALSAVLPVSGGHINPAVTVGVASMGLFPWAHVVPYIVAQHIGGFCAAGLIYGTHFNLINKIHLEYNDTDEGYRETMHMFAGDVVQHASAGGAFICSVCATAVFLIGAIAILDHRNMQAPKWYYSLSIGFVLMVSLAAFSSNGSPSVNPAADLPCRIFAHLAGWGNVIWDPLYGHYWYLCGILAPHLGAILGLYLYRIFVGAHFAKENEREKHVADEQEMSKLKP
ncbi:aquaporin-9-like protein [Dinothrombium tinctorium]|uniref:Aquaporin-9-like protein n=1 Tax=Dinothrombium tinctorium TaxID=1965070 RepID=A0A443RRV8_9ACAR|nr:aquaporin-9-like protein [Dinothrombium tinctorium]